jgi:hypothetical protein
MFWLRVRRIQISFRFSGAGYVGYKLIGVEIVPRPCASIVHVTMTSQLPYIENMFCTGASQVLGKLECLF